MCVAVTQDYIEREKEQKMWIMQWEKNEIHRDSVYRSIDRQLDIIDSLLKEGRSQL